jgi:hypothetical protein
MFLSKSRNKSGGAGVDVDAGILKPKFETEGCFLDPISVRIRQTVLDGTYFSVLSLESLVGAFPFDAERLHWRSDMLKC